MNIYYFYILKKRTSLNYGNPVKLWNNIQNIQSHHLEMMAINGLLYLLSIFFNAHICKSYVLKNETPIHGNKNL